MPTVPIYLELNGSNYQSGISTSGWSTALPPTITGHSGSVLQGSTITLTTTNCSTSTSATLQFVDFEGLTLGTAVVGQIPSDFKGASTAVPANYLSSNDRPLTGTRVAKAHPTQEPFGELRYSGGGMNEMFVEFYVRTVAVDFTSSPDAPQIKFCRMSSEVDVHSTPPYIGITIQGGPTTATLVEQTNDSTPNVWYGATSTSDAWERHTVYMKLSTPGYYNGMKFYRASFANQWNSPSDVFATPNSWTEPFSVTRASDAGVASRQIQNCFFPFFQRDQQETIVDINHIYVHNSLERVFMSTAPTLTASTSYKYVTCKTLSRALNSIQFVSMLDVFSAADNVYAYVANSDGKINTTGYLLRAGS